MQVTIAERRRPRPQGLPGYLRVDSVHQGDLGQVKGVYHINMVDEVTQFQFVGSVEKIAESFLLSVLEDLLAAFQFRIRGFHSDNGSEYVNHQEAAMLEKLRVEEFTNALVESKNGTVIRKQLGYGHIAERLNAFNRDVLTPYEKFRALPGAESFLLEGIDFAQLDAQAYQHSDNEAAQCGPRPSSSE